MDNKQMESTLAAIAKTHLHTETLETRHSDGLDFYDCSIWGIKAALEAAYTAGLKDSQAGGRKNG